MRIIIATNNSNKVREITEILNSLKDEFFSLKDLNIVSDPEEDGSSFYDNALIKAKSAFEAGQKMGLQGYYYLGDDSGLCVDALDGAPGIYSARFANVDRYQCSYSDNNRLLLKKIKDVEFQDRGAHFETCAVMIMPDGTTFDATGKIYGKIADDEFGTNGFGYDPIFIPNNLASGQPNTDRLTLAQFSSQDKNYISHRYQAIKKLFSTIP